MLTGEEHSADSRSESIREHSGCPGCRLRVARGTRSWRAVVQVRRKAFQLFRRHDDCGEAFEAWKEAWQDAWANGISQWHPSSLKSVLLLATTFAAISCVKHTDSPQIIFDRANKALLEGQVSESQDEAARAYRQYQGSQPEWASKFLVLEARAALER